MNRRCRGEDCNAAKWMRYILFAAALYNIVFALWCIINPNQWFLASGMEPPRYPQIWQAVGMIVGVYGIGYAIAATNPIRHWPIILVGFLGKIFGPIGFLIAVNEGAFPLKSGWVIVANDLIWLLPFSIILWKIVRYSVVTPFSYREPLNLTEATKQYTLSSGETLAEASKKQPVVLVFLRHFGCTFTRQILQSLQKLEADTEKNNARLVLVHMLRAPDAKQYLDEEDDVLATISDPSCELYRSFGLGKAGFWELFGPAVWIKGIFAIFQGCGVGHLAGDGLQMPGAFVLEDEQIISSQKAETAADLPNLSLLFGSHKS